MKNLKETIKNCSPSLYFLLYRLFQPLRVIKNKTSYEKQYNITMNFFEKSKRKRLIYLGVPIHNNLGDLAQYYCIKKWLRKFYNEYDIVEIADNIVCNNYKNILKKMKKIVTDEDIFVFQSGYRTTDLYYGTDLSQRRILNNFKNQVIVFPQTIKFKYKSELAKNIKAYKKNNNYIFLARDEISYQNACKMYDKNKILLYPDIVTSLIGNCDFINKNQKREGILLCLRNDDEKLYTDDEYNNLIRQLKQLTNRVDVADTNSNKNFEFDKSELQNELKNKLNQFASYKLIITDRYHGTIFSLVSNTNVIVLNSVDHKLSSGVNWFKEVYKEHINYCDDIKNVYKIASKLYKTNNNNIADCYFKNKYYDLLYEKINNMTNKK